jgi:hypothetical protein
MAGNNLYSNMKSVDSEHARNKTSISKMMDSGISALNFDPYLINKANKGKVNDDANVIIEQHSNLSMNSTQELLFTQSLNSAASSPGVVNIQTPEQMGEIEIKTLSRFCYDNSDSSPFFNAKL